MYNQFAAPMPENRGELVPEQTRHFLPALIRDKKYPMNEEIVATGQPCEHIRHFYQQQKVALVICGNHNKSLSARTLCSAQVIIADSHVDALLV